MNQRNQTWSCSVFFNSGAVLSIAGSYGTRRSHSEPLQKTQEASWTTQTVPCSSVGKSDCIMGKLVDFSLNIGKRLIDCGVHRYNICFLNGKVAAQRM